MDIDLDQRRITNAAKAMNLPGFDDENVTGTGFKFFAVDVPVTPAFPHELDFIVRMTMRARATPRLGVEEEYGNVDIAVVGPDEVVRAAFERQVFLTDAVHPMAGASRP